MYCALYYNNKSAHIHRKKHPLNMITVIINKVAFVYVKTDIVLDTSTKSPLKLILAALLRDCRKVC